MLWQGASGSVGGVSAGAYAVAGAGMGGYLEGLVSFRHGPFSEVPLSVARSSSIALKRLSMASKPAIMRAQCLPVSSSVGQQEFA